MNRLRLIGWLGAVLLLAASAAGGAWAGDSGMPSHPKPKGTACVEDTQTMRRNHMEMLKHQRDDTLRLGIRGAKYSLKDCVSCHAAEKDGKAVPVTAPGQFCESCHSYAAVSIDCFECHATTPGAGHAARTAQVEGVAR
ncbi:MAG: Hdr-like menaquinol oxidoreductase cytochrome c subunit [Actinomycetota bacterium]